MGSIVKRDAAAFTGCGVGLLVDVPIDVVNSEKNFHSSNCKVVYSGLNLLYMRTSKTEFQ